MLLTGCDVKDAIYTARPTIAVTGTYGLYKGEALGTLTLTGDVGYGGQSVEGTLAWKDGTITYNTVGEHEAAWVFTPADETLYDRAEGTVGVTVSPNIYMAGYKFVDGIRAPAVWKNGEPLYTLPHNAHSEIYALTVSDGDIYTAGMDGIVAKVWKNGDLLYTLTEAGLMSSVTSLAISGEDVYACGHEDYFAKVWKNGRVLYTLPQESDQGIAYSLALSGGDVYTGGWDQGFAKVWKNGDLLYTLPREGSNAIVYGLAFSDGDIYTSGVDGYFVKVWKNGDLLYTLTDGSLFTLAASPLVVSEGNIYFGGQEGETAKVWKNGDLLYTLTDGAEEARVTSLAVSDGSVYASGFVYSAGKNVYRLWKDGLLFDGPYPDESRSRIFVD